MIVINVLGGLFVFMVLAVIVGNAFCWIVDQIEEARRPPPTPPKVEWDEDKPLWPRKP